MSKFINLEFEDGLQFDENGKRVLLADPEIENIIFSSVRSEGGNTYRLRWFSNLNDKTSPARPVKRKVNILLESYYDRDTIQKMKSKILTEIVEAAKGE